ncbi:hypothetical protein DFH29DRAFT_1066671 [Suillus ampliporus]|nr:hypothetical protein DFH29DRAFT_1066671 [Suillus ampliporus]
MTTPNFALIGTSLVAAGQHLKTAGYEFKRIPTGSIPASPDLTQIIEDLRALVEGQQQAQQKQQRFEALRQTHDQQQQPRKLFEAPPVFPGPSAPCNCFSGSGDVSADFTGILLVINDEEVTGEGLEFFLHSALRRLPNDPVRLELECGYRNVTTQNVRLRLTVVSAARQASLQSLHSQQDPWKHPLRRNSFRETAEGELRFLA